MQKRDPSQATKINSAARKALIAADPHYYSWSVEQQERFRATMHETAYRYWGKAKKESGGEGDDYHLLVYHCLDVAAVASLWWDQSCTIPRGFTQLSNNLSAHQVKAWVLFFIALHDYGKFDIRFQRKAINAWIALQAGTGKAITLSTPDACKSYDHSCESLPHIKLGDKFHLHREADNLHDQKSIKVFWNNRKIGYVPSSHNAALSKLMDSRAQITKQVQGCKNGQQWEPLEFEAEVWV